MNKPISKPARLEDIAVSVGVSRSEVSRVLNGRVRAGKEVGAATRERILEVAREMNYAPQRAAQSLARGRTDTVALMIVVDRQSVASPFFDLTDELSSHYHELIGGLTYSLSQYGLNLLLAQCGGRDESPMEKMERIARSRTCDAMVLTDMLVGDQRPALLASTGLPFIVRGTSPEPNTVAVGMDNIAVGNLAVRHLYELGHRRILCYNIWSDLMSGARRYEGIQQAVEQLGLKDEVEIVLKNDAPQYENEVYESVLKRLNQPNFPTAIFAGDEIMALGAERALRESGLKIPEDVSLMMCLNARMMRLAAPHITSINVRQNESATRCGRLIAEMLRGIPVERRQQFLQPTLIPSKTTAPPRKHSI